MQKIILGVVLFLFALTIFALVDIISSPPPQKEASFSEKRTKTTSPKTAKSTAVPVKRTANLSVKKKAFIQSILPAVQRVKTKLDSEYARAKQLAEADPLTPDEEAWLAEKMREYNVSGMPCLLRRMQTHPVSLVIAQAALETGWGTSRFYKEAKNVFGIWSYHENEPRLAASGTRDGRSVYVKKYDSLDDSVENYFKMISDGYAYSDFRKGREHTDNPFALLKYLRHYSELRDEYVARLYYVLKANHLYRLDDPAYEPPALASIIPEYVVKKREEKAERQRLLALCEIKTPMPPGPVDSAECED